MNLHRLIISLAILGSAYAVTTVDPSTPPVVMQPVATPTVAPSGEGDAAVVEIPSKEASAPAPPSTEAHPQAVAVAAQQSPAAGGFCTSGNCGPAQARRVYQVQRPQRAGLFRGLFRGRR